MSYNEYASFVHSQTGSASDSHLFRMPDFETYDNTTVNIGSTLASLEKLRTLREDWDGNGSAAPNGNSIAAANSLVRTLSSKVATLSPGWTKPHVSSNEDGDVVLEWWHGQRKLTVYVMPRSAKYIKVWGPHIVNEMEDGILSEDDFRSLWIWLTEV